MQCHNDMVTLTFQYKCKGNSVEFLNQDQLSSLSGFVMKLGCQGNLELKEKLVTKLGVHDITRGVVCL